MIEKCLSFILAAGTGSTHMPIHVQELAKSRIKQQFEHQFKSKSKIAFDQLGCQEKGDYWYSSSSIILNADSASFSGRLELSVDELLANSTIDFNSVGTDANRSSRDNSEEILKLYQIPLKEHDGSEIKPLWPWILAGASALGVSYFAYRMYSKSKADKKPNEDTTNEPPRVPSLSGSIHF